MCYDTCMYINLERKGRRKTSEGNENEMFRGCVILFAIAHSQLNDLDLDNKTKIFNRPNTLCHTSTL